MKKLFKIAAVVVVLLLLGAVLWTWSVTRRGLAQLDGKARVAGLSAEVTIERDDHGVPTILADDVLDATRALGFLHGQERFFQMDLMRRQAAGELAALVGPALLEQDREMRLHRFRAVAQSILAQLPERAMAEAYAEGVNAGLQALRTAPFEYRLLRTEPEPWLAEDIFLVVHAMYMELQGSRGAMEISLGVVHDTLPTEMAHFLTAPGSEWEAPLEGTPARLPLLPDPEVFDLRSSAVNSAPIHR